MFQKKICPSNTTAIICDVRLSFFYFSDNLTPYGSDMCCFVLETGCGLLISFLLVPIVSFFSPFISISWVARRRHNAISKVCPDSGGASEGARPYPRFVHGCPSKFKPIPFTQPATSPCPLSLVIFAFVM